MKAEYTTIQDRIRLGDPSWHEKPRKIHSHLDDCNTPQCNDRSRMPNSGPHVWHVKDEEPLSMRRLLQSKYRVPYFFENSVINGPSMNESLEFWLSPPSAGAFAHADSYCQMTASVQLDGGKQWRMMNPGPPVPSLLDSFDTQDSGIYRENKWFPTMDFEVPEGAGVVFAPYNIHETVGTDLKCSTSTTFNFFSPMPTRYIRIHLSTLMNTHYGRQEKCQNLWDRYATWVTDNRFDSVTTKEHFDWVMKEVDRNGDEIITETEIVTYFTSHRDGEWGRSIEYFEHYAFGRVHEYSSLPGLSEALQETVVGDVLAYHDLDENGEISSEELLDALQEWHRVHRLIYERERIIQFQDTIYSSRKSLETAIRRVENGDENVCTNHTTREFNDEVPYWLRSLDFISTHSGRPFKRAFDVGLSLDRDAAIALPGIEQRNDTRKIPRFRNVTREFFAATFGKGDNLSLLDRGGALVIEDASRGLVLPSRWKSCQDVANEFGDAKMRREYDGQVGEPEDTQRLSDTKWMKEQIRNTIDGAAPTAGPTFAPFYWGVKEQPEFMSKFQELEHALPYFFPDTDTSRSEFYHSPEMWFAAPLAGAKIHGDPHCEATISIQLSGRKRWRVGSMLPVKSFQSIGGFIAEDGSINATTWGASHETILSPGEAIIIPPGFLHETTNLDEEECAASITYQTMSPLASLYIRYHYPRLELSGSVECRDQWSIFITLMPFEIIVNGLKNEYENGNIALYDSEEDGEDGTGRRGDGSIAGLLLWSCNGLRLPLSAIHVFVQKIWKQVDKDKNKGIDVNEVEQYIKSYQYDREVAKDALALLDVDGNNAIEFEELLHSWEQFIAVEEAVQMLKCDDGDLDAFDVDDVHGAFALIDENNDGLLRVEELKNIPIRMYLEDAEEVSENENVQRVIEHFLRIMEGVLSYEIEWIEHLDEDGNSYFTNIHTNVKQYKKPENVPSVRITFLDEDADSLSKKCELFLIPWLFESIDLDHDEMISFDEFLYLLEMGN
eukprot:g5080.t1